MTTATLTIPTNAVSSSEKNRNSATAKANTRVIRPTRGVRHEPSGVNLQYEPETAGRIMSTDYCTIDRNMTVGAALEKVRIAASTNELIYTIYVTNPEDRLDGVVSLRKLLIADSEMLVAELMNHPAVCVTTDTDRERAARILADHDFLAIPVVDEAHRMVGILTADDAIDILDDEATEDLFRASGVSATAAKESERSELMIRGSIWAILKARLPFLLITLVAGLVAGRIVEHFEQSLEAIVAIAFFIPLIMDMGGNVGSQSSTVFARAVALGHVDIKNFTRPFLKEVVLGAIMGLIAGIGGGLVAGIWQGDPSLGLAVGFALLTTVTLSALLGFLVPWALVKIGTDQAAGSAPIITSIKDITGLIIYFGFIALFMSHML
ncbi:MAG: magnesium transporter [Cellulomonadaceae bacterium]|jgi:magnesium transporter|nr:magnesium transporter [Cellulomonadaceae bacterium]